MSSDDLLKDGHFLVIMEHLMGVVTKDSLVLFRGDNANVNDFAERLHRVLAHEKIPLTPRTTLFYM